MQNMTLKPIIFILITVASACLADTSMAGEQRSYPGYMWSQIRHPSDVFSEQDNTIAEGALQQGIDWMRIGPDIRLNTFAEIGLKRDSDDLDWNNENKLSIGGKFRYFGIKQTLVSIGAKYDIANRGESNRTERGITYFTNWYSYWDLSGIAPLTHEGPHPLGFPGTTWGQLRYPASQFDVETHSTLIEGAIEQGIDWVAFSEDTVLNTFLLVDYTFDSKGLEWNNKVKLAPGVKIKAFVANHALLELGVMHRWHHRTESDRTRSDTVAFLNFNTSWDFGEFARKSFGKAD